MASSSHGRPMSAPPSTATQLTVLTSNGVEQGNILWLAPIDETSASLRQREKASRRPVRNLTTQTYPDAGFYNHPILVISRPDKSPNSIHFLLLTSFSGTALKRRFKGRVGLLNWPNYIPVSPATDHPLYLQGDARYRPLHLENGLPTNRPGYVKVSEVYEMDWRDAQPYWHQATRSHSRARLDAESLKRVLTEIARLAGYVLNEQYSIRPATPIMPISYGTTIRTDAKLNSFGGRTSPVIRDYPPGLRPAPISVSATVHESNFRPMGSERLSYSSERAPLLPVYHGARATDTYDDGSACCTWSSDCVKCWVATIFWMSIGLVIVGWWKGWY